MLVAEFVAKAAFCCHNEFVGGVYLEIILFVCMQSNEGAGEGLSELTVEQEEGEKLSLSRLQNKECYPGTRRGCPGHRRVLDAGLRTFQARRPRPRPTC